MDTTGLTLSVRWDHSRMVPPQMPLQPGLQAKGQTCGQKQRRQTPSAALIFGAAQRLSELPAHHRPGRRRADLSVAGRHAVLNPDWLGWFNTEDHAAHYRVMLKNLAVVGPGPGR
jgi:hypothetical protein